MALTLLKGNYVMTPEGLKAGYGVEIEGNRIRRVGPVEELLKDGPEEIIECKDEMILPGFVNGHNHMYGFLSHGITAEAMVTDFSNFLEDYWWPCVEDRVDHELAAVTAKQACVEMIDSGVTSFLDILEGPSSIPGALMVEKEVIEQAGLRGLLSFEACERKSPENGEAGLKENIDLVKSSNKEGALVQGLMSIHTLFTCSKEFIKKAKEMCRENHCLMHMHLSESVFEPDWCKEHYGKRPVEVYDELGCLDEGIVASQLVQVDEEEIRILAERGVKGVSMPLSNCEVGGGVAPVGKMLEAGMTVGLGTDGYVNNFFEVMRGAFLIHKAYLQDPQAMPAKTVYEMATSMGADAIGVDAGRLEAGRLADLITVKLDTPTPVNDKNIYDQLVLFRNPEHVTGVMVNGAWVKRNGRILTLDKEAVRKELSEKTEAFWNFNLGN